MRTQQEESPRTLLERSAILIAAGGDASRFILPAYLEQLARSASDERRVPIWMRGRSFATHPIRPEEPSSGCFIDLILGFVRELQSQNGLVIPVTIISGPNNDGAIREYLSSNGLLEGLRAQVIRQEGSPVFVADGRPIRWEDGAPLLAPDGTAGCVDALRKSDWFHAIRADGADYIFVWYVNDPMAGTQLIEYVGRLANSDAPFLWISEDRGGQAIRELAEVPRGSVRHDLIVALEDAPGCYVLRASDLDEIIGLTEEHMLVKRIPVLLPDDAFLEGVKRERFLADAFRKAGLLQLRKNRAKYLDLKPGDTMLDRFQVAAVRKAIRGPVYECIDLTSGERLAIDMGEATGDSRAVQASLAFVSRAKESLRKGITTGVVSIDIGEKQPGDLLTGSYRVVEVKRGAFGVVYLCEDGEDGERVAVKTYSDEMRWAWLGAVQRFWHEANQWVLLPVHPHLVTAEYVEEIDGRLHIFLEYVDGGDLRNRLRTRLLNADGAVKIAMQVCAALVMIHSHGLVHRDIKPENILLTRDDRAKLTDLGLVAAVGDARLKEAAGTRGYWAPEQIKSPHDVSTKADVYALGVVLYEILAGCCPQGNATSPAHLNPQIPSALDRIVMDCLALDPARRPTAAELAASLAEVYHALTGETCSAVSMPGPPGAGAATLGRINSLAALDRHQDALELCEARIRAEGADRKAQYTRARLLFDLGRYEECAAECLRIGCLSADDNGESTERISMLLDMCAVWLGIAVRDADYWGLLGQFAALGAGSSGMALKLAETALKLDSEHCRAWTLKAESLYCLGRYEEALRCYERGNVTTEPQLKGIIAIGMLRCRSILQGEALTTFRYEQAITAGRRSLDQGTFVDAKRFFEQALEIFPASGEALELLGLSKLETGEPNEALDCLDRALAADSTDGNIWYHRGLALHRLNRLTEALESYDQALRLSPDHAKAWNNKGAVLLEIGDFQEARRCFKQALDLNPESERALRGIESCDAYVLAQPLQTETATSASYWVDRGVTFAESGQLREALACFRTAVEIEPQSADTWYNAGYALWMLGQHRAALEHCDRALALNPKLVHAWNIRGNALDDLGRTGEALESFERAIGLDARYFEAWNGKGLCFRSMSRLEEALACFDQACTINPDYGRGWYNKALTLSDLGSHEEAIASYDRALAINPEHPRASYGKGCELVSLHRLDEAAASFRQAIETDAQDYEAWNNLGSVQLALGESGEAMKSFSRALAIAPDCGEARRNLDRVRQFSRGILR